ncbi:hypothetical protein [Pseudonocardia acidicola]|uniref:Uncharacterized protein n=1 Tax=Pseudonocardia acidicola TaxID=2724939 RepID=A0ABX1SF67_9PSEU|nr:hypothetical protein [Pseudonocardia acidicola]NMH98899.1 hypothetical protein [Pseudonocardia acidicola]
MSPPLVSVAYSIPRTREIRALLTTQRHELDDLLREVEDGPLPADEALTGHLRAAHGALTSAAILLAAAEVGIDLVDPADLDVTTEAVDLDGDTKEAER